MPSKKRSWGDIPHINDIKDMDTNGKWTHCKICDVCIRVTIFFKTKQNDNNLSPKPSMPPKKRLKTNSCPVFCMGKILTCCLLC